MKKSSLPCKKHSVKSVAKITAAISAPPPPEKKKPSTTKKKDDEANKFEFSLNPGARYISFFSKSTDTRARQLSNFVGGPVAIDYAALLAPVTAPSSSQLLLPATPTLYATGEHAYQAAKYTAIGHVATCPDRKAQLMAHAATFLGTDTDALAAKRASKALILTPTEVAQWTTNGLLNAAQLQICRFKADNNAELRKYLASTGETYLVHFERHGSWPVHGGVFLSAEESPFQDGRRWLKGTNVLGKIWMEIRRDVQ